MNSLARYKLALAGAAFAVVCDASLAHSQQAFSLGTAPAAHSSDKMSVETDDRNLRRIGADRRGMFFNGESTSNEYPFYALPSEIAGSAKLVLWMQTAISAAPENSSMRVFVNDQDVGSIKLQSGAPYRVEMKVPNGVIQPGYNAVSILVDQKHRVDCSIDATYELWTQIDPERSGFVFSEGGRLMGDTMPDLIARGGMIDGRTAIQGSIAPGATGTDYNRTITAIEALTIIGNFDRPAVSIGQQAADDRSIGVVVGTRGTVAEILGQQADSILKDGINVLPAGHGKGQTLVVTGRTAADVDASLEILKAEAEKGQSDGTPQGLRALANSKGRLLSPGSTAPLRNLGLIAEPFSGRLYKQQINFSMPSDFYPGDYGSLVLHLSAQYAANLSRDAELIVRANDETVADINLGSSRSGLIDDQRLPVPLSKLRPGENTIQFEARLPVPADVTCDPVGKGGEDRPRLLVLGKSFLEVPQFARVGRYPDIAALVSGSAFDERVGSAPIALYVPNLNSTALSAAASFMAKMAYSSGHILPVNVTATVPDLHQPNVMAFGTFSQLPSDVVTPTGLDLSTRITSPGPAINAPTQEVASALSFRDTKDTAPATGTDGDVTGQMLGYVGQIKTVLTDRVGAQIDKLRHEVSAMGQPEEVRYQPKAETALLIAQKDMKGAAGVWTVVASPSEQGLTATVDAIMDRSTWTRLNGSVQAFSTTGQVIDEIAPSKVALFQTQPANAGNLRLIVAGWFSHHVLEYTLAQIIAALLLGASTFLLLKLGRPKW
ncbi:MULTISPECIES: cellulose biosynthesis cyclic di-GMP-binding regulatory protein BcsB [unclassified Rhizobium]|uniref:cellulose biosynthesis cyclic di-GMP-binding regulatory protein BcsB n=1 Tax=unclassified Rhizobium TaxID=2613769 RepID=UPI0013875C94|nr:MULTISPECIES: cellulose biosynthesis cyclic di-GMP-binding regulatory protein BcsB [unclassified Rhizobium]